MVAKISQINRQINLFFEPIKPLGFWFLRLLLGIDFVIRGLQKFPVPSEFLYETMGLTLILSTLLPYVQIFLGLAIIVAGFFGDIIGNILTRLSALIIAIYMVFVFIIAREHFSLNAKLFTGEQFFLLVLSLFFLLRGQD